MEPNPKGRPSEYSEEVLNKAKEYLASCEDKEIVKGNAERPTYSFKVKLPSVEGLARHLKVARSTVYEWKGIYSEFSDILEELLAEQAEKLLNNGLSGDYNPTIAKLILTKHGYSDRQETDVTSKGEQLGVVMLPAKESKVELPSKEEVA